MAWSVELDSDGQVTLHTTTIHTDLGDRDLKHLSDTLTRVRNQRIDMGVHE